MSNWVLTLPSKTVSPIVVTTPPISVGVDFHFQNNLLPGRFFQRRLDLLDLAPVEGEAGGEGRADDAGELVGKGAVAFGDLREKAEPVPVEDKQQEIGHRAGQGQLADDVPEDLPLGFDAVGRAP